MPVAWNPKPSLELVNWTSADRDIFAVGFCPATIFYCTSVPVSTSSDA
jgi:hypothetical protein